MEWKHIDIAKLAISGANMRGKGRADLSNILLSVRTRGVLVPLIVQAQPCPEPAEGGLPTPTRSSRVSGVIRRR